MKTWRKQRVTHCKLLLPTNAKEYPDSSAVMLESNPVSTIGLLCGFGVMIPLPCLRFLKNMKMSDLPPVKHSDNIHYRASVKNYSYKLSFATLDL